MRKIVDGVRYNTENSYYLGTASRYFPGNVYYWTADLYVTKKTNKYFLAGEGGAWSQFGDGSNHDEKIIPLSEYEAFEWAQEHLETHEVEEYFVNLIEEA